MFYIEDATVEQNIYTAQQPESIYGLARLTGHDATRGFAAVGELEFRWKPGADLSKIAGTGVNIDPRAEFKIDLNGLKYSCLNSNDRFRLEKANKFPIKTAFIQGEFEKQTVTGTGENLQSFNASSLFNDNFLAIYSMQ